MKSLLTDDRDKANMKALAARFRTYEETHRRLIAMSLEAANDPQKHDAAVAYLLNDSLTSAAR